MTTGFDKPSKLAFVNIEGKKSGYILHFVGGIKRLIQDVEYVWENEMVHMLDSSYVEYVVNKNNLLFFERVDSARRGEKIWIADQQPLPTELSTKQKSRRQK